MGPPSIGSRAPRRIKPPSRFDSGVVAKRLSDLIDEVPGVQLVGEASDALDVVLAIRNAKPDTLILDLQIAGGTGLDVLRAVRAECPHIYVLICTNYAYPEYRKECLTAGANFFLDKSVDFGEIPAILLELIEKENKTSPLPLER